MAIGPIGQTQTVSQPFQWGAGGKRLTPEQIERERQIAASLLNNDYSPVQSTWQGLARLSNNLVGAFAERRANHAAQANSAESNKVLQALLAGSPGTTSPGGEVPASGGTPSGNPAITAALTNPYIDASTRQFAMQRYADMNKRAQPLTVNNQLVDPTTFKVLGDYRSQGGPEIVQLSQIANDPARPEYERNAAAGRITALNDPFATIPLPGGTYVGPRSGIPGAIGGGGGSQPPATLPPNFNFGQPSNVAGPNPAQPMQPGGKIDKIGGPTPHASGGFR